MGRKSSVRAILPMSALYETSLELPRLPNVAFVVIWSIEIEILSVAYVKQA